MTDFELFMDMLVRREVAHTVREETTEADVVRVELDAYTKKVEGYSGFYTWFSFNKTTGELLGVGVYE